jgi:hypothetical protein
VANRFHSEFPGFLSLALGLLFATPIFAWESGRDDGGNENALVVVDANNKLVGSFGGVQDLGNGNEVVLRNENGVWVSLGFSRSGFSQVPQGSPPSYFFTSTNCTGTKYFSAGQMVPPMGTIVRSSNNTNALYFPGFPVKVENIRSELNGNRCLQYSFGGMMFGVGPAQSVNLDDYKGPFTIKSVSQVKSEKAYQ